jgi:hypothetical protein
MIHAHSLGRAARHYPDGIAFVSATARPTFLLHVARGAVTVNGTALSAGDGLKLPAAPPVAISNGGAAEGLVFDLPGERHQRCVQNPVCS